MLQNVLKYLYAVVGKQVLFILTDRIWSEHERASGQDPLVEMLARKAIGRQVRWPEAVIFRRDGEATGCVPRQPDAARQRGRERPAVATLGGRAVKGCEMSCGLRAP